MTAVILGSGIVFLDGTIVNVALPADGARPAGDLRGGARRPGLHHERLPRRARGALDHLRGARRSLRPAPGLRDRARQLRDRLGTLRSRADHGDRDPLPAAPGRSRCAPRPGIAVVDHGQLRRGGAWAGVRHLGGVHVRADGARPARRGRARRPALMARRIPAERAACPGGVVRDPAPRTREPRRGGGGPARLARLDRDRDRGRRYLVRADPRPGAAVEGPARVRGAGHRRDRRGDLPDPDGQASEPADSARVVPEPQLHRDQPVDVPDLRRPVRDPELPEPLPAGCARIHGDRGIGRRTTGRDPAQPGIDARRDGGGSPRAAPLPGRSGPPSWPWDCSGTSMSPRPASPG